MSKIALEEYLAPEVETVECTARQVIASSINVSTDADDFSDEEDVIIKW